MPLYADAIVPVTPDLAVLHAAEIASFVAPGTWLNGEERLACVEAARAARSGAGLQREVPDTGATPADVLPDTSLDLITRLAVRPHEMTRDHFLAARNRGMSAGEYVETVSLVSRIVNVDIFARGVGAMPPALPAPVDGEPDYDTPRAVDEGAWLPTVPAGAKGGQDALRAYGGSGPQPFIYRALSLVPAEAVRCIIGGDAQYLPLDQFMDFSYSHHPGLSRIQVEIVAARVSALNDCFY